MALGSDGGRKSKIIHTYNLEADEAIEDYDEVIKRLRTMKKDTKNLESAEKELGITSSSLSDKMKGMASSMTSGFVKGTLLVGAINKLKDVLIDTAREVEDYSQAQHFYTGTISDARAATMGFASDLEIMQSSNKIATLGIQITDDEVNQLFKDLTVLAPAMGTTFADALSSATTALARQSLMIADNVGVTFKLSQAIDEYRTREGLLTEELTKGQSARAFTEKFLTESRKKAKRLGVVAETLGTNFKQMTNFFKNAVLWLGNFINTAGVSIKAVTILSARTANFTESLKEMNKQNERADALFLGAGHNISGQSEGEFGGRFGGISTVQNLKLRGKRRPKRGTRKKSRELTALDIDTLVAGVEHSIDKYKALASELLGAAKEAVGAVFSGVDALTPERNEEILKNLNATTAAHWGETKALWAKQDALAANKKAYLALDHSLLQVATNFKNFGKDALTDFTSSLWDAADQAIQSEQSFGEVVLNMLKSVTLGLAAQLTAKGLAATYDAAAALATPFTAPLAAGFAAAAGIYFAGAAAMGGAGIGLSFASKSVSGAREAKADRAREEERERKRAGKKSAGGSSSGRGSRFGKRQGNGQQTIHVHAHFSDTTDPTARFIGNRVAQRMIGKAA